MQGPIDCKNCGAKMAPQADGRVYVCPFCQTKVQVGIAAEQIAAGFDVDFQNIDAFLARLANALKTAAQNVEMPNFTQALYDARELAMERLQYEAQTDGATGVVGAEISEWTHGAWDSHVIEFFAVGTSVVPYAVKEAPPTPLLVMSVDS